MIRKIKTYFDFKNSLGLSRKDQILRALESTKIHTWTRKLEHDSIFNILFVIENLQGDIIVNVVICGLGKSIRISQDWYVDWWKDNRSPYIVYWKMIGKRHWEK